MPRPDRGAGEGAGSERDSSRANGLPAPFRAPRRVSRMSDIERSWTISTPIPGGSGLYSVQYHGPERIYPPACESIEVVPAEQLRGAVAENERLRQVIMLARDRLDVLPISPRLIIARDGLDAALDGGQ